MKFILCEVSSSFPAPSPALWPHDYDCMMGFSWVGTCALGTFSPSDDGEKKSIGGTLEIFTVLKGKRMYM